MRPLKLLIATCWLLSLGAARADTYTLTGSGDTVNFLGSFASPQYPIPISGTIDVGSGSIISTTLLSGAAHQWENTSFEQEGSAAQFSMNIGDDFQEIWLNINFDLTTDLLTFNYTVEQQLSGTTLVEWGTTDGTGSFTVTPLPSTLPLFASCFAIISLLQCKISRPQGKSAPLRQIPAGCNC